MNLNRWSILAVLFFARFTMAFQFQATGALSPLIIEEYSASLADIGLLVGLYLAPGVFIAIPGGAIAVRFGDKRIVALGMVMMLVGGLMANIYDEWNLLVASRLMAGAGGVILNVVMTKMLVDWFSGKEISTAMAIFVNSWPVGIAAALLVLPVTAQVGGLALGWWMVSGLILAGLVAFLTLYQPPEGVEATAGLRFARLPLYPLTLAGIIWALYNAALAMVFSFGPALLNEQGWSLAEAGTAISAFMVIFSIALPLGGILADWTGRRDSIIAVSLGSFAVFMPLVPLLPPWAIALVFLVVGGLFALAAGPIMTLLAAVLPPESRTFGIGGFLHSLLCGHDDRTEICRNSGGSYWRRRNSLHRWQRDVIDVYSCLASASTKPDRECAGRVMGCMRESA
ncbi:MFS transporter [Roseibium sp. SCPC15]|uniref:MFS transporter n=1 Tax=Roseibium sp. SCP15 TaxID=3141376 RepID=UPI00333760FA